VERTRFREALSARCVQTSVHYPPIHCFSMYAGAGKLPMTEAYGARTVTLPLFATMTTAQQDAVVSAVRAALGARPSTTGALALGT